MADVNIRLCTAADLPAVAGLLAQLDEVAHSAPRDPAQLAHVHGLMAAQPELYLNLVAELAGEVAGLITLVFYQTYYHRGGTALINELVVDRAHRGQGIGALLMARAIDAAQSRGVDEIEVGTERDNLAAQRFYRQHGFDEESVLLGREFEAGL